MGLKNIRRLDDVEARIRRDQPRRLYHELTQDGQRVAGRTLINRLPEPLRSEVLGRADVDLTARRMTAASLAHGLYKRLSGEDLALEAYRLAFEEVAA
jgi:hypothetical protein